MTLSNNRASANPDDEMYVKNTVIYLSHGDRKYHKQTIYSVYSLLFLLINENESEIEILIYTDNPAIMPKHDLIRVVTLTKSEIKTLKGPLGYVHRTKLGVLAHAVKQIDGPMIYVDCDTKWIKNPQQAFSKMVSAGDDDQNIFYMHVREKEITAQSDPGYYTVLCQEAKFLESLGIQRPWHMWNAGVIGVGDPKDFFEQCLAFTDRFVPLTKRKNWIEQLAISLLANSRSKMHALDDYVIHLWHDSFALPHVIDKALEKLGADDTIWEKAKSCANFPVEQELLRFRLSLYLRFRKWVFRTKISYNKRRLMIVSFLIRMRSN